MLSAMPGGDSPANEIAGQSVGSSQRPRALKCDTPAVCVCECVCIGGGQYRLVRVHPIFPFSKSWSLRPLSL